MNTLVYARFVYDQPYLNSFIRHYESLGFKKILLLFHESFLLDKKIKEILDKDKISSEISIRVKKN